MSDLRELYQQVILDHNRNPRNFRLLENPSHLAHGNNPLCGDKITVLLNVEEGQVKDVAFQGAGCAICMASSSMMTEAVTGKENGDIAELFSQFHDLVTGSPDQPKIGDALGKLAVFAGVCEFPVRVKCASLAWHTLKAALEGGRDAVATTE